jgi:hypothetical protein
VLCELFKLTQLEVCCGEYKARASGVVGTRMPSELIDEVAMQGVGEFHTTVTTLHKSAKRRRTDGVGV